MATNTLPGYSQGATSGSATNRQLLNDLNIFDRSFEKNLVRKYGAENYALVQMALGNSVVEAKTDNRSFYHYEKRGLHQAVQVRAAVTGATAGAAVNVTIGLAAATVGTDPSYYVSGAGTGTTPLRVGEVVRVASTGVEGQVTAINTATGVYPQIVAITPLQVATSFNLTAGDFLLLRGAVNIGEQSAKLNGMSPILDKIFNTTTEHRDDFTITDRADIEKNEVDFGNGNYYYYYLAQDDMNRRYMNNLFFKVMEGTAIDNPLIPGGTVGTTGVLPRVAASGSTIQYLTGGTADQTLASIHALTRSLNFYGGAGDYHWLQDIYQRQQINDVLFGKYQNGAISYGSVGGSQEAAVSYGFSSFMIDGYTFHFFLNNMFSPESVYHVTPTTSEKRNYGCLIPQKINSDAKTGKQFPSFQIVFQEVNGQRVLTTETGMLANQNKTTDAQKTISMLSFPGVRVFAANQYAIFQGVAS
jgi:hypothetical protein